MSTQRLPIIVPDDDATHEAIGAAILRETGYRMLDPEVIVRSLRLLSVAHRDGIEDATVAAILDRARRAEEDREFEKANYARMLDELREQHEADVRAYIAANRGGLAVYWLAHEAKRQGRKTLRVADILAAMESAKEPQP